MRSKVCLSVGARSKSQRPAQAEYYKLASSGTRELRTSSAAKPTKSSKLQKKVEAQQQLSYSNRQTGIPKDQYVSWMQQGRRRKKGHSGTFRPKRPQARLGRVA